MNVAQVKKSLFEVGLIVEEEPLYPDRKSVFDQLQIHRDGYTSIEPTDDKQQAFKNIVSTYINDTDERAEEVLEGADEVKMEEYDENLDNLPQIRGGPQNNSKIFSNNTNFMKKS